MTMLGGRTLTKGDLNMQYRVMNPSVEKSLMINLKGYPHMKTKDMVVELLTLFDNTCLMDLFGYDLDCEFFLTVIRAVSNAQSVDRLYDYLNPVSNERHVTVLVTKQQPDETILSKLAKVEDELDIRITGFECK